MTNEMQALNVVLGTGPLGMAVMRELHARGRPVRMVNRSGQARVPAGVDVIAADLADAGAARRACAGAAVVYNCLNAPYAAWPETFPPLLDGAIAGAAAAGAKLVVADNLYMYGPVQGPLTETLPYAATGRKGRTRAQMAETVLAAHRSGKLRATIGRASDFYGPGVLDSAAGAQVFGNALAGKAADVLGDPDRPHTYTYIDDFGRGLVTLGEHDTALGEAWHVPSAPTLTTRQFITMVYEEAGETPRLRTAPSWLLTIMGVFNPSLREMKEMLYEFEEPFVVDHSKFAEAFGADPTPHREAIRETLAWYREHQATN